MKIPNSELVARIVKQKLEETGLIESQEELEDVVSKELGRIDEDFHISGRRARRIALEMPEVGVKIETRKSRGEKPDNCPACGEKLEPLHAENLMGEEIQVGFRCPNCGYRGDVEEFMPMRYKFRLTKC